jgi:glycosyltransferase involved in cell wall biosynthesis
MYQSYPKISIVTPSYNQGKFIEQTILSVIGQNYPNLEYIIIDGGSTDNTIEIIKKYEKYITYWISQKDNGQSEAINKGFRIATGSILAWLNSDDYYLPNILFEIANKFSVDKPKIVFGNCIHIKEGTNKIWGSRVDKKHESFNLLYEDYIIQPSSFWNKLTWDLVGNVNENLHYGFDWDWFIRALQKEVLFESCQQYFSIYRIHENHKSGTGADKREKELQEIYKNYAGAEMEQLFAYLITHRTKIIYMQELLNKFVPKKIEEQLLRRLFFPKLSKYSFKTLIQVALMAGIDMQEPTIIKNT